MRLPLTLSAYLGRHFLIAVCVALVGLSFLIAVIELLELLRRAGDAAQPIPFRTVMGMMLLKLPTGIEKIYPFAALLGGMFALARLTRSSELAVARAAGVSVWQFLLPGVIVAFSLGCIAVGIINPIAATTIARFDRMEAKFFSGNASLMSLLPSGLWLRQNVTTPLPFYGKPVHEYVLHAQRINQSSFELLHVTLYLFDDQHHFVGRLDGSKAQLQANTWIIADTVASAPDLEVLRVGLLAVPTRLTLAQIQDSFAAPETFSFWELPHFITVLENAGFSALSHKLHFYSLMALPPLLVGMLMLSAVFSLRTPRRGATGMLMVIGVGAGFIVFFVTNIIYAFGAAGTLPVALAAWAPSLIVGMVATAALLHLEDG